MTMVNSAQLERMIREATTINATQKAMLHAARWWMDWQTLEFYPAIKTWAKAASLSHQTIITHVRKLQHLGVIEVGQRTEVGRSRTNVYRLRPSALQVVIPSLFDEPVGCTEEKVKTASVKGQILSSKRSNPQREKVKALDPISNNQGKLPPQPPRTRGNVPDLESAPAGGGRGGEFQSRQREGTPTATPARPAESGDTSPTREATREPRRRSEAINAPGANPLADAIEALGPSPRVAAELAALPHVTAARVQFVAEQAAKQQPNRPDRWAAMMLGLPDDELSGYRPWLRKHEARAVAIDRVRRNAIRAAIGFAHHHKDDAVYGRFCRAVLDAMRGPWPMVSDAVRDGQLPREMLNPNASPLAVLRSLALSCGSDIEIPTDTLRMPEAAPRTELSRGATNAL